MPLSISASTVKSWFQYRCERKTRYETLSSAEQDAIPLLRDIVEAPWAELGNAFEQRVINALAQQITVLRPAIGEDYLSQQLSSAFLKGERCEQFAAQLTLEPSATLREHLHLPPDVSIRRSFADLVRIDRSGPQPVFQVIDIKATQRATPFHKTQVAFYSLLLRSALADLGVAGSLAGTGEIWHLPAGSNGGDGNYEAEQFRLEPYIRLVSDFFRNEVPVIADKVVAANRDNTFFHIYFKCEQCQYLRHCRQAIADEKPAAERDVSAVAGVSHEAKRSLLGFGVRTVGQLAGAQGLRNQKSSISWALKRRAEVLTVRARALVDDQISRMPGVVSYLMPPRVDIGLYLVVDVDPVEGNLIALGYLNDSREGRRFEMKVLADGGPEHERSALCRVMGRMLEDLAAIDRHNAEHEDSPNELLYAHIFLYEPSEGLCLQEAIARHLDDPTVRTSLLNLIRLFPPEDIVPEPEFRGVHHLPATALRSVVEQLYALPVMVSYDLRQVTQALARDAPGYGLPYTPAPAFARPYSSRLSIDVCRRLREERFDTAAVEADVRARLSAMCTLTRWLLSENQAAANREGDRAFLRLNKLPFRFQETFHPLDAADLDVLQAFELLENRAGLLNTLIELAQPYRQRRDRARCMAELRLKKFGRTGRSYWMLFEVPVESRETDLSSADLNLILTNDDPDNRLNPQLWPSFEVRIAPERSESDGGTVLVLVPQDVYEGDEFQRWLRAGDEQNWFLDRTFKDFTMARAAQFMAFLAQGNTP